MLMMSLDDNTKFQCLAVCGHTYHCAAHLPSPRLTSYETWNCIIADKGSPALSTERLGGTELGRWLLLLCRRSGSTVQDSTEYEWQEVKSVEVGRSLLSAACERLTSCSDFCNRRMLSAFRTTGPAAALRNRRCLCIELLGAASGNNKGESIRRLLGNEWDAKRDCAEAIKQRC